MEIRFLSRQAPLTLLDIFNEEFFRDVITSFTTVEINSVFHALAKGGRFDQLLTGIHFWAKTDPDSRLEIEKVDAKTVRIAVSCVEENFEFAIVVPDSHVQGFFPR